MGSLPNLNDLYREKEEKKAREKERELARELARERDFSRDRDRDRLPTFTHQAPLPKQHHRHSLTSRRVLRTRSSGATYHIWDDPMIEHMTAYSPISSRSHRVGPQIQPPLGGLGGVVNPRARRESINSSIGANSVRRLLTVNLIAHGLTTAALVPLIGLQGSSSAWFEQNSWIYFGPDIGSILLSLSFFITAGMCLLATRLIRRLGYFIVILVSYSGLCFYLATHFFPSIYVLLPGYIVLGITLGPAWVGKLSLVVSMAGKLSCGQHECYPADAYDSGEHRNLCSREENVRRLARWYHAAQDLGIIFGALLASTILSCVSRNESGCLSGANMTNAFVPFRNSLEMSMIRVMNTTRAPNVNDSSQVTSLMNSTSVEKSLIFPPEGFLDAFFNTNEHGERICGADLCPVWLRPTQYSNATEILSGSFELPIGTKTIIGVFLGMSLLALALSSMSGHIDSHLRLEPIRGISDTLLFAGPMAYFIGTEQGYILSDYMKAFVSCSLGPHMVAGALVGMGIMQSIASCTLSMLLRHTKRIVVIVAGFFFHACLLLVLSQWKPSSDDSALFYVITAAWGVCNAVWETLIFALVSITHTNHVAEVTSPLQALRFLGLGITFAAHGFLCENPKILILSVLLVVCVPPYAMLEMRLEAQRKSQAPQL
ncbi:uncharacterized protein LOC129806975 isoform X2 [Phlebotomus papatasi]|uniref:uncharacterized protein LOC129806975 isoform X2 n=1 Tax=Phlebotomus papatasi TaxID=29031 RepID=UPI002483D35A|nr:uncharacterized protein LOC129806975 isoform X2 [Phlebotomus papatasi]